MDFIRNYCKIQLSPCLLACYGFSIEFGSEKHSAESGARRKISVLIIQKFAYSIEHSEKKVSFR